MADIKPEVMRKEKYLNWNIQEKLTSGKKVTVCLLKADDRELLSDFFESVPEDDQYYFYPHPLDKENAKRLVDRSTLDKNIRIVAISRLKGKDKIAGYIYAELISQDLYSYGICIRREFQSEGLGGKLTRHLLNTCKETGVRKIQLTVHKTNKRAIKIYRKYGFKITGEFLNKRQNVVQHKMLLKL